MANELIDDMRHCGGSGVTLKKQVHLVSAFVSTERARWVVATESKTNLPATMLSCASPSSILNSAPLGFAPSYGFNKVENMSGVDVPLWKEIN